MPRFTLRELLLFTAVIALAVGWWSDRRQWASAYRAAAWNYAYATTALHALGYRQVLKDGRVAEIVPPTPKGGL